MLQVDKQIQNFLKPQQNNFFHQAYNINANNNNINNSQNNNNNFNDTLSQKCYRPYSQQKQRQRFMQQNHQKSQNKSLSTQNSLRSYYSGGQRQEHHSPVKMQKLYKPRNSNLMQTIEKEQNEKNNNNKNFNPTLTNSFQKNTVKKENRYENTNNTLTAKKNNDIHLSHKDIQLSKNNSPLKNHEILKRPQSGESGIRIGRSKTYNNAGQNGQNLISNFLQQQSQKNNNNNLQRQNSVSKQSQNNSPLNNNANTLSQVPDQANLTNYDCFTQVDYNYDDQDDDDGNKCYGMDYTFLDNLTLDDPRLKGAYAEELLNNSALDIEYLIDKDPDYFHHIFGNCACAKCTCTKCKCRHNKPKLSYKNGYSTAYSLDFTQKSNGTQNSYYKTPALNQTHYNNLQEQFESKINVDPLFKTTSNMNYVTHKLPKRKPKNNKYIPNDKPIQKLTSYGSSFANWNDYDPTWKFKAPQHVSTVNSRVNIKTHYSQEFRSAQKQPDFENVARNFTKTEKTKPYSKIFSGVPNKTEYQLKNNEKHKESQKINLKRTFKYETETQPVNQIPSYHNQFKTTQTRDFDAKQNFDQTVRSELKEWYKSRGTSNNWKRTLSSKLSELIREKTLSNNLSNNQVSQF